MDKVMTRQEVYDVVDGERDYQNLHAVQGDTHIVPDLSLGETLVAMHKLLNEAINEWYVNGKPFESSMHNVRKITALGVQIGEQLGMPRRKGF
jgi:hypothetical protein